MTQIPQDRRRKLFLAQCLLTAAKGVERSCFYTYDHSTMGFMDDNEFREWREGVVSTLAGRSVSSVVSYYSDVYATIGGKQLHA